MAQLDTLLRHIKQVTAGQAPGHQTDRQLLHDFASRRDENAFAGLVVRHGPMVLRVCRRVLGQEQDAEDAFQATFLILARRTGSIRNQESLSSWLYRVAYRTAMKAKRSAARRRHHEGNVRSLTPTPAPSPTWDDVQSTLDEEIQRLPEAFRAAFVLCIMEGKTGPEAAALLGCKPGTVSSRLARARQQLQRRLARRGIKLGAVLASLSVAESAGRASVPATLVRLAIRSGLSAAAGEPAAGVIPAHVAALAAGVTRAMFLTKVKIAVFFFLALSLLTAGAGVLAQQAARERSGQSPPSEVRSEKMERAAAQAPAASEKDDRTLVSGQVLGPDGRPVAGAKLFLCDQAGKAPAPQPSTDRAGRFHFALAPSAEFGPRFLVAMADGLGLDWAHLAFKAPGPEVTLRLPADLPIRGRVVDLEGNPVAGAEIGIVELSTAQSGNLDEFLKQWAADKDRAATGPTFRLLTEKRLWVSAALAQLGGATTGPDGTFRMTGIGRDRALMLSIRAAGKADHYVRVVMRPDFLVRPVHQGQVALSGPQPSVALAPGKSITGILRDAQTKEPLAGVRVRAYNPNQPFDWWSRPIDTVTDAQGRYRLDGLAKATRQIVAFDPGAGNAHMHRFDEVGDTPGLAPTIHDTELHRGIVVVGQVTDRATGRPVRARVVYCPLFSNASYNSTPGYARPNVKLGLWIDSREMITGADGKYRLTALPGPGALFVRAVAGQFTQPTVRNEDRAPGIYRADGEVFLTLGLGDIFPMSHLHAYRLIHPVADAIDVTADFALDPGVRRRGRLLDPKGKPVTGAIAMNLTTPSMLTTVLSGSDFTAEALNLDKPRRLLFWHRDRKLAGTMVVRGDEPEPLTVTLQPLAAITGRALRKNGEPLVGYAVEYDAWPELELPDQNKRLEHDRVLTDKEGRFRLTDVPAGMPLNVSVYNLKSRYAPIRRTRIILTPGKTETLGDLRVQGMEDEP
jgi:RNA polymerase sigma factor (sigma-70 family)